MTVIDQVKKAQSQITEQINENPTAKELLDRLEELTDRVGEQVDKVQSQLSERAETAQSEFNERAEAVQNDLNERFDELTKMLVSANTKVAEAVTARLVHLPGAERMPQPKELVETYFDAVERFTASNRDLAIKLVSPWLIAGPTETTKSKAAVTPSPAKKTTARKSTARKSTARKATARKSTARKSTARKSTARKAPARKATATNAAS